MSTPHGARPEAAGFGCVPLRAAGAGELSQEALRVLVAVAAHVDDAGWCGVEPAALAAVTGLSAEVVSRCLADLETALYLARNGGPADAYRIVSDLEHAELTRLAGRVVAPEAGESGSGPALPRGKRRGVQRLLRAWHGVDRFQFWARIVLSPEQAEAFWRWALDHEDEYDGFVQRFAEALNDSDLEGLLQDMVSVLADRGRGKRPAPAAGDRPARSGTRG